MAITKYEVKRRHLGDKDYFDGDEREAEPAEVKHLVASGVLVEAKAKSKPKAKGK